MRQLNFFLGRGKVNNKNYNYFWKYKFSNYKKKKKVNSVDSYIYHTHFCIFCSRVLSVYKFSLILSIQCLFFCFHHPGLEWQPVLYPFCLCSFSGSGSQSELLSISSVSLPQWITSGFGLITGFTIHFCQRVLDIRVNHTYDYKYIVIRMFFPPELTSGNNCVN